MQRAIHYIVALGAVLAAYVLDHPDISAFDDHLGGIVVTAQDWSEMRTLRMRREGSGIVGRACQQYGRALGAFWHEDDGVQLHSVTHWDHHVAANVVEAIVCGFKLGRRFARESRYLSKSCDR